MNCFNMENRIRYRTYRQIRFQTGMPFIHQSQIILGAVANIPVRFDELKMDHDGWINYEFSIKEGVLHEFVTLFDHEKELTLYLTSLCSEEQEIFFTSSIHHMLPVYAYGSLLFSTPHVSAEYQGTLRLLEYLHQVYDGTKVSCTYRHEYIRLKRDEKTLALHVTKNGDYFLTPDSDGRPLNEEKMDPAIKEWAEDIEDILHGYKGFYVAEEKASHGSLCHPTETWRAAITSLHELLFNEELPSNVQEVLKGMRYQRTLRSVAEYISEAESGQWLFERTVELLHYEQHIQTWLDTYDYDEFLFRKEPYHIDY